MVAEVQLQHVRLRDEFVIHVLDLGHDSAMQGFVFVSVIMATGGNCRACGSQKQGGHQVD